MDLITVARDILTKKPDRLQVETDDHPLFVVISHSRRANHTIQTKALAALTTPEQHTAYRCQISRSRLDY